MSEARSAYQPIRFEERMEGWNGEEKVRVRRVLSGWRTGLEHFIAHLREAAEGLEDPFVSVDGSEDWLEVAVEGLRAPTDDDRAEADRIRRVIEIAERAQYDALRAKFEAANGPSPSDGAA